MKNLKCKVLALCMGASVFMCGKAFSQVPSYVPTNGLVGWWPFNGNANDESGNGNNGTINGATLTTDRFGNVNKAYSFDGTSNYINLNTNITSTFSLSIWVNVNQFKTYLPQSDNIGSTIIGNFNNSYVNSGFAMELIGLPANYGQHVCSFWNESSAYVNSDSLFSISQWKQIVATYDGTTLKYYDNGLLIGSVNGTYNINQSLLTVGARLNYVNGPNFFLDGKVDDIAQWNRALTQQEITVLYNSCQGTAITSQPSNTSVNIGSNAQFSVNAAVGSTYQWQNNPLNNGWQNVNNNSTYSGSTTNTLTVSNTSVSNHNQPFRAIVNTGACIDTSNVAQIIIGDTCLTTVTDTLIINTTLGLPAPNNENTILIYPNPASDHITIDNGNYTAMSGYTIKIENNAGQQVFQSAINQQQFYVDLSTWSGNGLYFVHLINAQGNTVTVRKIVLQ